MKSLLSTWLLFAAFAHAAGLEFPEILKEIKAPSDVPTVTADFDFTNKSDKPVSISKSDGGCSCMKVQVSGGKLKYEPGESGVVRATFEMGNFSGTVDKMVAIWVDGDSPSSPSLKLTVRIHIPVLVNLDPKTVRWNIEDKAEPKIIKIQMSEGATIHVNNVTSSSESFSYELKTLEKGKNYELAVIPKDTKVPGIGVFRIETDCAISKHQIQQAFAVVSKPTPTAAVTKP